MVRWRHNVPGREWERLARRMGRTAAALRARGLAHSAAALATTLVDAIAAAPDPGAVERRRRGRLERPEDRESGPPAPPRPATRPSRRLGSTSPRRSVRTAGSPARPAATRVQVTSVHVHRHLPRRHVGSRASARGPPGRHRRPHTFGPGSARRSAWSPLTTTGSRRPLTRTSSTSSSSSRPDMTGNTARPEPRDVLRGRSDRASPVTRRRRSEVELRRNDPGSPGRDQGESRAPQVAGL